MTALCAMGITLSNADASLDATASIATLAELMATRSDSGGDVTAAWPAESILSTIAVLLDSVRVAVESFRDFKDVYSLRYGRLVGRAVHAAIKVYESKENACGLLGPTGGGGGVAVVGLLSNCCATMTALLDTSLVDSRAVGDMKDTFDYMSHSSLCVARLYRSSVFDHDAANASRGTAVDAEVDSLMRGLLERFVRHRRRRRRHHRRAAFARS